MFPKLAGFGVRCGCAPKGGDVLLRLGWCTGGAPRPRPKVLSRGLPQGEWRLLGSSAQRWDRRSHQQTDLFLPQVLQFPCPLSRSVQPVQTSQLHTLLAILLLISSRHVFRCQQFLQSLQSRQHGCGIDYDTTNKTSSTQCQLPSTAPGLPGRQTIMYVF